MTGTSYWYMHTDQWRFDGYQADALASPLAEGHLAGLHTADTIAKSARLGWMPFYPQFDRNPMDLADEAIAAERRTRRSTTWSRSLTEGNLKFAVDDVDAPENWPRTLVLWRSNLLGSSAKGNEYFLKYLLGTHSNVTASEPGRELRPSEVRWRDDTPEGKLDLLVSADFRMTSTTLLSDIVFPAATWYEKHDLSTTDMHPFVHAFSPAIDPPWEAKSDFDTFHAIARKFSEQAKTHLGTRKDLVSVPMLHDTPGETAQPGGHVATGPRAMSRRSPAGPCRLWPSSSATTPPSRTSSRAIGPLAETLGFTVKGVTYEVGHEVQQLARPRGRHARRRRRRAARDRHRHEDGRGDPDVQRHDERRAGRPGVPLPGEAGRQGPGRPRGGLGGEADHLRRHPGTPGAGRSPRRSGPGRRPAGGATRRSPSTSSASSPGTR